MKSKPKHNLYGILTIVQTKSEHDGTKAAAFERLSRQICVDSIKFWTPLPWIYVCLMQSFTHNSLDI